MKRVKKQLEKFKELKVINSLLTITVVILAFYIITAPFLPQATFAVREQSPAKKWLSQSTKVEEAAEGTIGSNRIFIPKLGLQEIIYEGGAEKLSEGVVRRPLASTPDRGSNTVIVGHRFTYDQKGVFYHLDKLSLGDKLSVHWEIDKFDYEVIDIFIVKPEEVSIESQTDESILTIYTCTPLWSAKERLVVRAKLL